MLKNLLKQPTIKLLPQCITVGLEEPCRGGDNPPDAANGDSTHLPSSLWALLASHDRSQTEAGPPQFNSRHMKNKKNM